MDIARSLDDLTETAMAVAFRGGAHVLRITALSRAESLSTMLDFSAKFMEPIVRQLDPTMIHWSSTLLGVSTDYAERLLRTRSAGKSLSDLPRALVENYPAHSFVISRDEAAGLGLPVRDLAEYDLADVARRTHRRYEEGHANLVSLVRPGYFDDDGDAQSQGGDTL